jgi:hypothetical protein
MPVGLKLRWVKPVSLLPLKHSADRPGSEKPPACVLAQSMRPRGDFGWYTGVTKCSDGCGTGQDAAVMQDSIGQLQAREVPCFCGQR